MDPQIAIPFPNIDPAIFTIGPFDIGSWSVGPFALRWYALAYIAGLVLGWWYMARLVATPHIWPKRAAKPRNAQPDIPATRDNIDDLLVWITLGVILGGRFGYVLFYKPGILVTDPLQIFFVWQGGMSFHGGFLGVALAIILFCWSRRIDAFRVGDLVAAAVPIGLFFGRIANFINGELWGKPSTVPWAMVFPGAGPLPRHPSQLYEAALEGIVLFVVLRLATHVYGSLHRPGLTIGLFALGYGVARILVEFARQPDEHIGYLLGGFLTMGMVLSLPLVILGALFIWRATEGAPDWLKANPFAARAAATK